DMAGKRFLLENGLDRRAQSRKTTPQVRHPRRQPDLGARRWRNHRISPSSAALTQSGSTVPSMRTRAWPKSISMMPVRFVLDFRGEAIGVAAISGEILTGSSVVGAASISS